jgi:alpha-glucoside transport system substrate-binding protein
MRGVAGRFIRVTQSVDGEHHVYLMRNVSRRRGHDVRRFRRVVLLAVFLVIAAACSNNNEPSGGSGATGGGGGENTGSVNVLSALDPSEAGPMQGVLDSQINSKVDYKAEIEADGNFEQDVQIRAQAGTLDVILLPQPGAVIEQAKSGNAVSLEDMGFNIDDLNATFGEYFMSLGEYNGEHYGIPTNINLKSMVWYAKDDFDKAGYKVPTTWDEMLALSDQIVADGGTPWCVGFGSEGATGWPATDWIEDIMLRTAGLDTYTKWTNHEIPFNDPSVLNAAKIFGDLMFHPGYVLGGADKTPSIQFGDAPLPMFDEPPGCWLHRQASFITSFFPKTAESGVDYDWFPLPPIDQDGTLFAGELAVTFRNAPEVKDFLTRFMSADVQCAMGSAGTSRISPNVNVGPDCYTDPILADASVVLTKGLADGTAGFDASDQMPPAVGSGSFWTGMVKYMQDGPDSLDGIMEDIEKSWPSS